MKKTDPILVHVGYYKTGTTWLQKHVFGTGGRGFTPLCTGMTDTPKKASKYLGSYFYRDRQGQQLSAFDYDTSAADKFISEFDLPTGTVAVISNERLLGYFVSNGNDAPVILSRLKASFPHARILVTVRRQREMVLSCYLQYLKRGGTMSLETLLAARHDDKLSLFSRYYFEYHHAVGAYAQLFGRENVLVLPYELFLHDPNVYVQAIYEHAGLSYDMHSGELNFGKRENALQKIRPHVIMRHVSRLFYTSSLNFHARSLPARIRVRAHDVIYRLIAILTSKTAEERTKKEIDDVLNKHLPQQSFSESNKILQLYINTDISQFGYY